MSRRYWLVKSEPSEFSISDLKKAPRKTTCWDGVRNYQARNFMRDDFRKGDYVFFYHSNADPKAIMGICQVVRESYPDHTAFDPKDKHYDPKSAKDNPRWYMVDLKYVTEFDEPVTLDILKGRSDLKDMPLVQRGSRLSVQPVAKKQWTTVLKMAGLPVGKYS